MDIEGLKPIPNQTQMGKLIAAIEALGAKKLTVMHKNRFVTAVKFEGDVIKADVIRELRKIEDEPVDPVMTLSEAFAAAGTAKNKNDVIKTFLLNNFGNTPMEL